MDTALHKATEISTNESNETGTKMPNLHRVISDEDQLLVNKNKPQRIDIDTSSSSSSNSSSNLASNAKELAIQAVTAPSHAKAPR